MSNRYPGKNTHMLSAAFLMRSAAEAPNLFHIG
jgi:hypothetical protein